MTKIIYGVDPAFGVFPNGKEKKRVGIASIYTDNGAIAELRTMTFTGAVEYLKLVGQHGRNATVVVEVPKTKVSWHGQSSTALVNVGMGLAAMKIMAAMLDLYWLAGDVVRVHPRNTKLTHEQFSLLTGWSGKACSQDARNAAIMAMNYYRGAYRAKATAGEKK